MKSTCIIAVAVLAVVATSPAVAQQIDVASYDIEVTLDPDSHELQGSQSLRWRNTTGVTASELWFHLYLNAFASSESTFMREMSGDPLGRGMVPLRDWGWTRVTRLALADGTDLTSGFRFERPDDGNENDFTLARVELPRPVLPGESVTLEIDFEARLPRVVARTGFSGDFHMVAQWFPKIAVFEGESGWNRRQFHAASEFFADFGDYRVRMTIPRGWVVGATGEEISREPVGTDDVVEFRARGVHDFAWATAPPELMEAFDVDFDPGLHVPMVWLERASDLLGIGTAELGLPPMTIRFLVPRSHGVLSERMVRAARLSIAWFGLYLGPYPYPRLTVVSPPVGAEAAGGMEYPTLITTGASRLDASPVLSWRSEIEGLTAHEIGHQYFQSLVASNEFEDAWLDEGLTSWATTRCVAEMASDGLVPEVRFSRVRSTERLWATFSDLPVIVDRPNWERRRFTDAWLASYVKPSLALGTLEGLLGEDRVLRAIRAFFSDHRYRHPTGDDFQASLEGSTGEDLEWFFDAVIRGDEEADWAVLAVRHDEVEPPVGMMWTEEGWVEGSEAANGGQSGDGPWEVSVEIGRRGDLVGPVEIELLWDDDRRERRTWDSRDRWVRWTEESPVKLRQVVVDPDAVWVLETRRADNYWRREAADPSIVWWLGGMLRLAGVLVSPWS